MNVFEWMVSEAIKTPPPKPVAAAGRRNRTSAQIDDVSRQLVDLCNTETWRPLSEVSKEMQIPMQDAVRFVNRAIALGVLIKRSEKRRTYVIRPDPQSLPDPAGCLQELRERSPDVLKFVVDQLDDGVWTARVNVADGSVFCVKGYRLQAAALGAWQVLAALGLATYTDERSRHSDKYTILNVRLTQAGQEARRLAIESKPTRKACAVARDRAHE